MNITKDQVKSILAKVGDALDGTPDGTFSVAEVAQRVAAEASRVATLPDRVAAHPVEYFWKGTLVGVLIGAAVVAPIAYGVSRAIFKGLGL